MDEAELFLIIERIREKMLRSKQVRVRANGVPEFTQEGSEIEV